MTSEDDKTIIVTTVSCEEEISEIKALQLANSKPALTPEEIEQEGFVTAQYTVQFLKKMHSFAPSIIAKDLTKPKGQQVIGYVIVTTKDVSGEHDLLDDLFRACDQVKYFHAHTNQWCMMKDINYTLSGQLCVAKGYRNRGLVTRMYHHYRDVMCNFHLISNNSGTKSIASNKPIEYCMTDVAMSNPRSVKAHLKAGFDIVETLVYANVDWYIISMPIQSPPSSSSITREYETILVPTEDNNSDSNSTLHYLQQISVLQLNNSKHLLCREEQQKEGFVTAQYPIDFLIKMHHYSPAVVTVIKNTSKVVGYALTTTKETEGLNEAMDAFFEVAKTIEYEGKPLHSLNYVVCGQLCVAKGHRGVGLVTSLYDTMIENYKHRYDYLVTDVSESNGRSLKAHLKCGFEIIATLPYVSDVWYIVLKKMNE